METFDLKSLWYITVSGGFNNIFQNIVFTSRQDAEAEARKYNETVSINTLGFAEVKNLFKLLN